MRRCVGLCLAGLLLAAGTAWAVDIGVGAFGGPSFTVLQQDAQRGSTYGVRVPVKMIPILTVEPYLALYKMGEGKQTVEGYGDVTRSAFDGTTFGANVILGSPLGGGFKFYPFAGIGTNKLTRDGSADISDVGYTFGLGLDLGLVSNLSLTARGELNMVTTGDTSRKFANATVGLTYQLFQSGGGPPLAGPATQPPRRQP
ncbi:MAG TPA: outer membrane beta-barrel protein [Candidatus Saccharimonadales bacterium]|nr:outer membrane beta-barrel protein [Candidatus Saccharimonadales bacterium]